MRSRIIALRARLRGDLVCHEVLEVLQSYLDGETDEKTAIRVSRHLSVCKNCELEAEAFQQICRSLRGHRFAGNPEVIRSLENFGQDILSGRVDPST